LEKQAQLKIKDKRRFLDKSWLQIGTKEIVQITEKKPQPTHAYNSSGQRDEAQEMKNRATHALKRTSVVENSCNLYDNNHDGFSHI
jgi:hypothetical protein